MTSRTVIAVMAALFVFSTLGAVIAILATGDDDSGTTTTVVSTTG